MRRSEPGGSSQPESYRTHPEHWREYNTRLIRLVPHSLSASCTSLPLAVLALFSVSRFAAFSAMRKYSKAPKASASCRLWCLRHCPLRWPRPKCSCRSREFHSVFHWQAAH